MSGLEASLILIGALIVVGGILTALLGVTVFFLDRLWR